MVYLHTGPMGVHRACFFIARAGRAATPERNHSGNQPPILCILPLVAHQLASARDISIHFTSHLFRPWIPDTARHRRWTPMIHRGRARRTISAGSWFGQWSPDPPSVRPQLSQPPTVGASRGDLGSAEWRVQETLAERVPDRRASPGNLRSAERRGRETLPEPAQ